MVGPQSWQVAPSEVSISGAPPEFQSERDFLSAILARLRRDWSLDPEQIFQETRSSLLAKRGPEESSYAIRTAMDKRAAARRDQASAYQFVHGRTRPTFDWILAALSVDRERFIARLGPLGGAE